MVGTNRSVFRWYSAADRPSSLRSSQQADLLPRGCPILRQRDQREHLVVLLVDEHGAAFLEELRGDGEHNAFVRTGQRRHDVYAAGRPLVEAAALVVAAITDGAVDVSSAFAAYSHARACSPTPIDTRPTRYVLSVPSPTDCTNGYSAPFGAIDICAPARTARPCSFREELVTRSSPRMGQSRTSPR